MDFTTNFKKQYDIGYPRLVKLNKLSDDELKKKINSLPIIINLAWHIKKEIHLYLRQLGFKGKIIDIL